MFPANLILSNLARKTYHLEQVLFPSDQPVRQMDPILARQIADRLASCKGHFIPYTDILALGLMAELDHLLLRKYGSGQLWVQDLPTNALRQGSVTQPLETGQEQFLETFTPAPHPWRKRNRPYRRPKDFKPANVLQEMLLLHLNNGNPAIHDYLDLMDESPLMARPEYAGLLQSLVKTLASNPASTSPGQSESLLDMLLSASCVSPNSLAGQLEYMINRWQHLLSSDFLDRLKRGLDLLREASQARDGTGGAMGSAPILKFEHQQKETENYSRDLDWMPNLVLIARNTYVWLEQLSRQYQRPIQHLDHIPDEELDRLSQYGFNGLWLIGLWDRSPASRQIKLSMGNPDAVSSAYSIRDYQIADDLGGWQALDNLRQRAWQRGIRLSADMVPNHMGIDSTWVMEHPDWFLSLSESPFPSYTFNGQNLSHDDRAGIYIEDHYYTKSDAAVVFKRVDNHTGETRYIYHGNDGTSMPWNDTAQLNYLDGQVREAVIQTILHVARNFPIIRFDAAMTLASKHIQRLWFPEPGEGGAIPSRSEHGLSHADFKVALPGEFWREVVDRVAAEVPDTLLLAEAFWLMEGYFVRTLGMHRVYNSAFMHMLRDEDNAAFRSVIKNVLEFDPQILKRFVNFMNNPDEKTAIEQFGEGDKYFGVCTLLVSLPGLPMFGHGQLEGFHEKYGMEYRQARWQEPVNEGLLRGHAWHIFPLLKKRALFSEMDHFALYDFFIADGKVNEDVFAYSNGIGNDLSDGSSQRSLVVYHNRFAETSGWIKTSVACLDKSDGRLKQVTLGQALGLRGAQRDYTIFRDVENGLEYIRPSRELIDHGLHFDLKAYQHHAFVDFREVWDEDGDLARACDDLNGAGYWSVQARADELRSLRTTAVEPRLIPPVTSTKTKKKKEKK